MACHTDPDNSYNDHDMQGEGLRNARVIPNQDSQRQVDIVVNLIRRKCVRVCCGWGWGVMKKAMSQAKMHQKMLEKKRKKKDIRL